MIGLEILAIIIMTSTTALSISWFISKFVDAIRYNHLGSEIFKELMRPCIVFTFSVVCLILLITGV